MSYLLSLLFLIDFFFVFFCVSDYFSFIADKILDKYPKMSRIIIQSGFLLLTLLVFAFFVSGVVLVVLNDLESFSAIVFNYKN